MDRILKTEDIPQKAKFLYVKLYCERKAAKGKRIVRKARKSWDGLSLSEKKQFYKTSDKRNLLKDCHSMRSTEPYLKKKFLRKHDSRLDKLQRNEEQEKEVDPHEPHATAVSLIGSNAKINEPILSVADASMEIEIVGDENQTQTELDNHELQRCETNSQERNETTLEDILDTLNVTNSNQDGDMPLVEPTPPVVKNETTLEDILDTLNVTNSNQDGDMPLVEPTPPVVKGGRDLYEMVKKPGDKAWSHHTAIEKSHYNTAVRVLKRDYIKNYAKYLESLTQQQLFDHYKKTLY